MELLRREKIQERFKKEIVSDTDKMVKNSVQEMVGWMVAT